jgi:hypothetical protein
MPHTGPLNSLAATAFTGADAAVHGYLSQLTTLLVGQGGEAFNYAVVRNMIEDLRYKWVLSTKTSIDKDVQAIINLLKAENLKELGPLIKTLEKNKTLLPNELSLTAKFNTVWDRDTWKAIATSRAEWHSLSESLWRVTDNAQRDALTLIWKASMEGLTFGQVKKLLEALLRRNRIVAQQTIWKSMGYITRIKLLRSPDADPECEICGSFIGFGPGDEKIVPIDETNLPPYHPWCKCYTLPVEPSKEELRTYLDINYGRLPLSRFQQPLSFIPSLLQVFATPANPSQKAMEKMFQEAHAEDLLQSFDSQLKTLAAQLQAKYRWLQKNTEELMRLMHESLDNTVSLYGMPPIKWFAATKAESGAYYEVAKGTIFMDPTKFVSTAANLSDMFVHEYGHFLQYTLEGKWAVTPIPSWLLMTEIKKSTDKLQEAFVGLKAYAFRTMQGGKTIAGIYQPSVSLINYSSWSNMPDNVRRLSAANQLLKKSAFLYNPVVADSFGAAFYDLTGGLILAPAGHRTTYFEAKKAEFLMFTKPGMVGKVEQEAINEFTSGYLAASASERISIDAAMFKWVPDLWTPVRAYIDWILGH